MEKIFNVMNNAGKMERIAIKSRLNNDGCFKTISYKNISQAQVMLNYVLVLIGFFFLQ